MRTALFTAAASLALVACGNADPDTDGDGTISMEEAQASLEASGAVKPQAGQYNASVELLEFEAPGAPPQALDMMRGMIARDFEYCLTQEQADKGFEEMARSSQDGDCSFEKFDVDGGDFDAVMICSNRGDGSIRMAMEGTGTETSSDMTMTMTGDIGGMGEGRMVMRTKHERIGDCAS